MFSAVAGELGQLLGAGITKILRFEPDGTATVVGGWSVPGMDIPIGTRLTLKGEGVAVMVKETGVPARTERFQGPPGSVPDCFHRAGARRGVGSPIIVEGVLWGVAVTAYAGEEPLAADSEARIGGFTELVATAIANAQAREELLRFADDEAALRRVATLVGRGEPPDAVFAAVAAEAGGLLAADLTLIGRFDDGTVTGVAGWGASGDPGSTGTRVDLGGRNVTTLVFETGRPVRLNGYNDASGPAADEARFFGIRSSVGAPITVAGRLWGVMVASSTRDDGLGPGVEQRLAQFTELVSTAIANAEAREELRAVADEQAALRRVATLVAQGAPPATLFATVAEEVGQLFGADSSLIRYDADGAVTIVGSWSRSGDPLVTGSRLPLGGENVSTLVFETGRPARIDRYIVDDTSAVTSLARSADARSGAGAPISVEGRLWGAAALTMPSEERIPVGTAERLGDFTELVATAIANAEAQADLTASRARIVATADETRRRIERDLHDGAQQRLVSLGLRLRATQAALAPDLEELAAELDRVASGLNAALDELRELSRGIHPAILTEAGLGPALRTLARRSAIPVEVDVRTEGRLPEQVEVGAYYVVSEALANAVKHAHASSATVELEPRDEALLVRVCDDGVGGAEFAGGSGLVGLRDRVGALGGRMELRSTVGSGTSLSVELPLTRDAAAVGPEQ